MQLLPDELRAQIPPLYTQEPLKAGGQIVRAKYFIPNEIKAWFVIEAGEIDGELTFFGYYANSPNSEWKFFTLKELQSIKINNLTVERDLDFKPVKFGDALNQFQENLERRNHFFRFYYKKFVRFLKKYKISFLSTIY
jgi:hypothetical protein